MSAVDAATLSLIDELQLRYIDALDSRDMKAWLETFSAVPEASYICTTAESMAAHRAVALILDDCHGRLEDRVTFVNKVWQGTYQEYQTRHLIQRTRCGLAAPRRFEVRTNFIVAFTPSDSGSADILSTGVYLDQVVLDDAGAKFLSRRAVTDTSVLPHYIVYPL